MKIILFHVALLLCLYITEKNVADAGLTPQWHRRMPIPFLPRRIVTGPKRIPFRQGKCATASSTFLKRKLESLGGFNKNMVSLTSVSARKTLHKLAGLRKVSVVGKENFKVSKAKSSRFHGFRRILGSILPAKAKQSFNAFSSTNNCLKRGSLTKHGNLNLCESCVTNTHLPANKFPRYLTEIKCNGQRKCIFGEGACVERYVLLTLLQKSGYCERKNGGFYMEEWVPYHRNVQVGCECEMKRGSAFALYVAA